MAGLTGMDMLLRSVVRAIGLDPVTVEAQINEAISGLQKTQQVMMEMRDAVARIETKVDTLLNQSSEVAQSSPERVAEFLSTPVPPAIEKFLSGDNSTPENVSQVA